MIAILYARIVTLMTGKLKPVPAIIQNIYADPYEKMYPLALEQITRNLRRLLEPSSVDRVICRQEKKAHSFCRHLRNYTRLWSQSVRYLDI